MKYFLLFLLFFFSLSFAFSAKNEKPQTDSLRSVLEDLAGLKPQEISCLTDTKRISVLSALAWDYHRHNHDSAIVFSHEIIHRLRYLYFSCRSKNDFSFFIMQALAMNYRCMASFYRSAREPYKALGFYSAALHVIGKMLKHTGSGTDSSIAKNIKKINVSTLNSVAVIYAELGNYNKSLEYFFRSLRAGEEIDEKTKVAGTLGNIGNIYAKMGENNKAIDYISRASKIMESAKEDLGIALTLGNLGLIYSKTGNHYKGLEYFYRSMEISGKLKNKKTLAIVLHNIGKTSLLIAKKETNPDTLSIYFKKSHNYLSEALNLREKMGDPDGIASTHISLGNYYCAVKNYQQAFNHYFHGLSLSLRGELLEKIQNVYSDLSDLYAGARQLPDTIGGKPLSPEEMRLKSLYFYKQHILYRDSLNNVEKKKESLRKEFEYTQEKREAAIKAGHERMMAIAGEQNRRQKVVILSAVCGLLFVIIIAALIYRNYRKAKISNAIITSQNRKIEEQKQNIMDSIEYASRIQKTILTADKTMNEIFNNAADEHRHFVFYRPRDVVSGDFYWIASHPSDHPVVGKGITPPPTWEAGRGAIIICAVMDCTGHGVPGALMSMTGNALLNDIVVQKKIISPEKILDALREAVIRSLHQGTLSGEARDGMDGTICVFNKNTGILQCAGANNPCWIASAKGELFEIPADPMPIGFEEGKMEIPFTLHEYCIQQGDMIYMSTDGIIDQFGGTKNKKFTARKLKDVLSQISRYKPDEQKKALANVVDDWKGEVEQLDDMCLLGVRV